MKLRETALGNALGVLGAIYFVGCYVIALVAPDLYKSTAESWAHMVDLSGLWKTGPENFLMGLISFTVVSWVSGYVFARLYNNFVK
jgi:hypothetical protein